MQVSRTRTLPVAGLLGALLAGACDLAHADQKRFCASANHDYALCASRPDWCIASGGPECVATVEGANCSDCEPSEPKDKAPCAPKPSLERDCPLKAPRVRNGVFTPLGGWDWKDLDRDKLEAHQGQPLAAADVAALSDHDRHMLCGPGSGADWTGKLPCVLEWSADAGRAGCVVDRAFCASACATRMRNVRCTAKNLCSGVICP